MSVSGSYGLNAMLDNLFFNKLPQNVYHAIFQGISDPFNIIDLKYRLLWVNRENPANEIIGKICYEIYMNRDAPCAVCPVSAVLDTGETCVLEKRFLLKDGSCVWYEVRAYPVCDDAGNLRCVVKIGHDITNKKMKLEKQKRYVESLEKMLQDMTIREAQSVFENIELPPNVNLTRRELEVLRLMAEGLANTEIAKVLSISPHTVKSHVIHIFNKLGVNDRTQAAVCATRFNLI
ncbi:DNA-binding response regulator [Desulfonema ishimotonii]|uniref:DNA-binding response regulator n=1 Tax=Desulfonema ishimotonii TaxID=45657 RepID=A0A401FXP5_9BACT|nr:LuxR C-terminal-related transcriptional regulator [Desulfonema ishimotonii]GBC61740.1 DNA-binding response regulator [Desulfonema ishimotonii]